MAPFCRALAPAEDGAAGLRAPYASIFWPPNSSIPMAFSPSPAGRSKRLLGSTGSASCAAPEPALLPRLPGVRIPMLYRVPSYDKGSRRTPEHTGAQSCQGLVPAGS